MCGVFGYVGKKDHAAEIVFNGLKELEYRGYDSWGEAIWSKDNKLILVKDIGKVQGNPPNFKSSLSLGHTRWATHGGVTVANSHPQLDCKKRLALVHNGIIENLDLLKKDLLKKGHNFLSETDTEVAAHLLEENLKKEEDFWKAFRKTFSSLAGLNAIVVLDTKTKMIYAAKKGSPLVVGFGKEENYISSDVAGLSTHTKNVSFLEDNEGVILSEDRVSFFNLKTNKKIKPKLFIIPWSRELAKKGKFEHFMLKEIYEQPKIIGSIVENSFTQTEKLVLEIKKSFGTYLVGCGSAAHACLFGQYLFAKIAKRHVNFSYGSEFGYLVDFLTPKSLVIALSQSGETIDILEAVDKAKEKGAKIGALVNVLGSTLYRKADFKILLLAGPEKAVASTKAFSAKLTLLILLAHCLDGGLPKAKKELGKTIVEINKILKNISVTQKLAKTIYQKDHLFVVGRGLSSSLAQEAALKIKEVSYIHAEGFAAGELKHGVIALIEKDTPCIVLAPKDDAYGAVISGAMELKARGGYIIGVSEENRPDIFDYHLPVKDTGVSTAISQTVAMQLLAYFLAKERNCEIDKPRNLAKSVTVK